MRDFKEKKGRKMKIILAVSGMLMLTMALGACGKSDSTVAKNDKKAEDKGSPTAVTSLAKIDAKDFDGKQVTGDLFKGKKLTMVNVWGTFCGPCINEMPYLEALSKQYADKGVQIVGVPVDIIDNGGEVNQATMDKAKEIVGKTGVTYKQIVPNKTMIEPLLGKVSAIPHTIFVDEKGNQVGNAYQGSRSKEAWETIIKELMSK